jgi:hypothetical protein
MAGKKISREIPASESPAEALGKKAYEKELKRLHVELVKLQQWVVHKGLKVCIVFEGRDGAGKGGTIKAITERVSPRIFRVVALPAPTERREKPDVYLQRYIEPLSGGGRGRHLRSQLVQPRRGRTGDGFLHSRAGEEIPHAACPWWNARWSSPASSC